MKTVKAALSLCLVTDAVLCSELGVTATIEAAVRGGVTMVQLRDKQASTLERIRLAESIKEMLHGTDIPLIVNDDIEAALSANADGAHVGQDDMPADEARALLGPGKWLGVSCSLPSEVAAVDANIVDYVGLGPVYETQTKPGHATAIGVDGLQGLVMLSPVAIIAIGGLKEIHIKSVFATGVDGIAVVSAICGQPDPELAARALLQGVA